MSRRVNVTLPDDLDELVGIIADGRGVSMSRVLLNALEQDRMEMIFESSRYAKEKHPMNRSMFEKNLAD